MKARTAVLSNGYTFHGVKNVNDWQWTNVIRLPEIKTAELSTYGNFAKCHQAHFRISCVGLGMRLHYHHLLTHSSPHDPSPHLQVWLCLLLPGSPHECSQHGETAGALDWAHSHHARHIRIRSWNLSSVPESPGFTTPPGTHCTSQPVR